MKNDVSEDYLPFFKNCTLTSDEIVEIIRKNQNGNIATLVFKSGNVVPDDVPKIIQLIPDSAYEAYEAAIECNLTPEQQLDVIKTVPFLWRHIPAKRAIELGDCNAIQILEMLKLASSQLYGVSPIAIRSGRLNKTQMLKVLDMTMASLKPKNSSLAAETAKAMIESAVINEKDIITIVSKFPYDYSRNVLIEAIFEQRAISSPFIFSLLEICKEKNLTISVAIKSIGAKKLTPNEIVEVVRDYGESDWRVIEAAIKTGLLLPDQVIQVVRLGKQVWLNKFEKEQRTSALEKARLRYDLKWTWRGGWKITK